MLRLVINNPTPAPTDRKRLLDAIIRRALMTDSAPASFFGDIDQGSKKQVKP